jgi:hypothetical protein
MDAWVRIGMVAWLAAGTFVAPPARAAGPDDRLIQLAGTLGNASLADPKEKIRAIRELAEAKQIGSLASALLFDRANIRFEANPDVREAAALGLRYVCDTHNRMPAIRLTRIANADLEPEPRVRIAALRSLAAFEASEAAGFVQDAVNERREPDPAVRAVAQELVGKGLAAGSY